MSPYVLDEAIYMSSIIVTTHELQDILTCVLERDIEIGKEFFETLESLEMRECEDIRIEIVDSELEVTLDRIDSFEHLDKSRFTIDICPIASCILRKYLYLADSLGEHELHFGDDGFDRSTRLTTTYRRDDTEGTVIITSFSDFEILIAKWCMHIGSDFVTSPDEGFFSFSRSFDRREIVRESFFFGFFMCLFCFYYSS